MWIPTETAKFFIIGPKEFEVETPTEFGTRTEAMAVLQALSEANPGIKFWVAKTIASATTLVHLTHCYEEAGQCQA